MKKKAQIQIGETVTVLFVFFILIAIGFIFYVRIIKGNLESEKEELSELRSIGIAQKVMFLPELQCSQDNVVTDNCIDLLKLEYAEKVMKDNAIYYYDILEFSEVSLSQIYPFDSSRQDINIYSRQTNNFNSKFITNVPISLYDPSTRQYTFGVLTIQTLSK